MKALGTKRIRKLEKGPGNYADDLMAAGGDAEAQRAIFETVPESMKVTTRIVYKNDLRRMRAGR